jgi:putative endonuclease
MTTPGQAAEDLAAEYLTARGLRVLTRNYRVRGGEVDLVCEHGPALVFVEVRLRSNARFGGPAASIGAAKRRRLVLAAEHYLAACAGRARNRPCRFDAVLLTSLQPKDIEWIQNAFDAS